MLILGDLKQGRSDCFHASSDACHRAWYGLLTQATPVSELNALTAQAFREGESA